MSSRAAQGMLQEALVWCKAAPSGVSWVRQEKQSSQASPLACSAPSAPRAQDRLTA
eukprot:CAMPEP_0179101512 /NCGR_PEP_ID=MMETSP0796-20121207/46937_1 /TAXON_ID=73915 /ORGANISM="Pyrodinium bahamense, Strain pbaha01" /LENGTH=55 /DNA_ID=CAMNT_0020799363 /DNA_START=794 /DNA_END=961 /DNA_ORIENTATION=+